MSSIPETHEAAGQLAAGGPLVSLKLSTPKPGSDQVLVRVEWIAGTAVTVWIVDFGLLDPTYPFVPGESLVGEVAAVGEGVTDLKVGDKVLSFSMTDEAHGKGAQEYALLSKWNVGKLPNNITPQEAATIPDNFVTAYFTLFDQLGLSTPTSFPAPSPPADASTPILIWGGGGSVGQYAIQLLHIAGYKNVFAVASSRHHTYLRSLGATATFDYNNPDVAKEILAATGGVPVKFVFDTITDEEYTLAKISHFVDAGSKVAYLLPVREGKHGAVGGVKAKPDVPFKEGVKLVPVGAKYYQVNEQMKSDLQPKIMPELLEKGLIKPNRVRVIEGDSLVDRLSKTVDLLRRGEVSGERLVHKI